MSYAISIQRRAQKELSQLPPGAYEPIREAISGLAHNPRPVGCQKLTARSGWRIRVGDFRVIYEIDDKKETVLILHIGHRRDIYR
jgi:mRNA interferase RelE/StbE